MVSSVKDTIHRIIDGLSEDEAAALLAYLDTRRGAQREAEPLEVASIAVKQEPLEVILARLAQPLTAEQRERGLAALEQARILREELFRQRGGKLFPSSGKLLDQLRAERDRELP